VTASWLRGTTAPLDWVRSVTTATVGRIHGTTAAVGGSRIAAVHAFACRLAGRARGRPAPALLAVAIAQAHLPSPSCNDSRLRNRSILLASPDTHLLVHHAHIAAGPDRVRRRARQAADVVVVDLLARAVRPLVQYTGRASR
jgi:hypothetical protein